MRTMTVRRGKKKKKRKEEEMVKKNKNDMERPRALRLDLLFIYIRNKLASRLDISTGNNIPVLPFIR